jgi:hypothetical protein
LHAGLDPVFFHLFRNVNLDNVLHAEQMTVVLNLVREESHLNGNSAISAAAPADRAEAASPGSAPAPGTMTTMTVLDRHRQQHQAQRAFELEKANPAKAASSVQTKLKSIRKISSRFPPPPGKCRELGHLTLAFAEWVLTLPDGTNNFNDNLEAASQLFDNLACVGPHAQRPPGRCCLFFCCCFTCCRCSVFDTQYTQYT